MEFAARAYDLAMKTSRLASIVAISASLLLVLSGCFLLPGASNTGGSTTGGTTDTVDISDTYWSGTDSVGDFTRFLFQSDGTVAVTYNENEYDDPTDTWSIDGTAVTVTVFLDAERGNAIYTGGLVGANLDSMELSAVEQLGSGTWTVTLTQE